MAFWYTLYTLYKIKAITEVALDVASYCCPPCKCDPYQPQSLTRSGRFIAAGSKRLRRHLQPEEGVDIQRALKSSY